MPHATGTRGALRAATRPALAGTRANGYQLNPAATAARSAGVPLRPSKALRCGKRPKRAIMR